MLLSVEGSNVRAVPWSRNLVYKMDVAQAIELLHMHKGWFLHDIEEVDDTGHLLPNDTYSTLLTLGDYNIVLSLLDDVYSLWSVPLGEMLGHSSLSR